METAADCYRHAIQCDHLAKFALSDADRDVMLAAAVNWRKLAGSAEESREDREAGIAAVHVLVGARFTRGSGE